MRRSAAPSVKAAKRAKFSTPFLSVDATNEKTISSENQEGTHSEELKPSLDLTPSPRDGKPVPFKCPLQSSTKDYICRGNLDEKENISCFYSVVWGKISKKKHKKWDGDGICVTRGRTAILRDLEGKEIAKGSGYKSSELESLQDGSTLCIGGKEIEVVAVLSEKDFLSGKCFQQSLIPATTTKYPFQPTGKKKSFVQNVAKRDREAETRKIATPRHDVNAPDALVMPRPSASHQWEQNQEGLEIVDVVVDPHLSRHMRPHQREGAVFLYECVMGLRGFNGNGAILADDMGLGKTLQCISLIWTLHKQGPYGGQPVVKRTLIITPGSLVKNWSSEFKKWLGNERLSVYTVNTERRVKEFVHSVVYPVMIISYEMFLRSVEEVKKIKFGLVICDEAHRLKNTAIKTTTLISGLKTRRRILLTGTPVQNDLLEFHSLTDLCNPGILGTQASFRRVYEEPIVRGQQPDATSEEKLLRQTRASELNRITSMFFLRRNAEVNSRYLPPKVESVIFCRPSPLQLSLYRHLLSSRVVRSCLTSYSTGGSQHLVCIAALKKLCNEPSLLYSHCQQANQLTDELDVDEDAQSVYEGLDRSFPAEYNPDCFTTDHSGKLQVLSHMLTHIRQTGERLVLVSNYTQTLDLLQTFCEARGYDFLRLDGKTPTNKRQSLVDRFNNKHCQVFVFLLSSKAGGVGLNLIGASRLILFDIDWNPANDIQAMARVWRDGQKRTVHIYRLLTTGTVEEKIYQRQTAKQGLSGTVADAKDSIKTEFSQEDLKNLFTLHENTSCATHDLLQCTCATAEDDGDHECHSDPAVNQLSLRAVSRPCQLGASSSSSSGSSQKNLSIAELMEWEHFPCPSVTGSDYEDDVVGAAGNIVSFVFRTKTLGRSTEH